MSSALPSHSWRLSTGPRALAVGTVAACVGLVYASTDDPARSNSFVMTSTSVGQIDSDQNSADLGARSTPRVRWSPIADPAAGQPAFASDLERSADFAAHGREEPIPAGRRAGGPTSIPRRLADWWSGLPNTLSGATLDARIDLEPHADLAPEIISTLVPPIPPDSGRALRLRVRGRPNPPTSSDLDIADEIIESTHVALPKRRWIAVGRPEEVPPGDYRFGWLLVLRLGNCCPPGGDPYTLCSLELLDATRHVLGAALVVAGPNPEDVWTGAILVSDPDLDEVACHVHPGATPKLKEVPPPTKVAPTGLGMSLHALLHSLQPDDPGSPSALRAHDLLMIIPDGNLFRLEEGQTAAAWIEGTPPELRSVFLGKAGAGQELAPAPAPAGDAAADPR